MTNQECIENLQYLISDDCTNTQHDCIEEIKFAIKAIGKQIPKKPKQMFEPIQKHFNTGVDGFYCPDCGTKMDLERCNIDWQQESIYQNLQD